MNSWLFFYFVLHNVRAISIGLIPNASMILADSSLSYVRNGTNEQCLCVMVTSSDISAMNYFSNNTCQFFSNMVMNTTQFSWMINLNSLFYFLQLPSGASVTNPHTTVTPMPTTAVPCAIANPSLMGTTVFGNANGTPGNSHSELNFPWGITINSDKSMLITDTNNIRVLRVYANSSTGVVVASVGIWLQARRALYDASLTNLFVVDSDFCLMTKYNSGPTTDTVLFGSSCGNNLTLFAEGASFTMDSAGNFYIADNSNHRIMFWGANATSGVVLAGVTGVSGDDSLHLYYPQDITLDESHGVYYVADTFNHRILRYSFGSSNATVVAGGNGPGTGRNQLYGPCGIYLAKNNNTLYIADTQNNRIVRWRLGDTEGQTIAGDCNGAFGNTALLLNTPTTVAMDSAEKHLYVSDAANNRVQMFIPV